MLEHGGNLGVAARQYGLPVEHWLDLSTGINPHGYPIPEIPATLWQCLPQNDDALQAAAAGYYGTPHLLAAAGTQALLQTLPRLRAPCRIAIAAPTYAEHPKAWTAAGHQVTRYPPEHASAMVANTDVLLLCHPNNPTGQRYRAEELLAWQEELASRGGWLVVDEAFLDATPEHSLAPHIGQPGLIVLRSLGKFFGLAGARVGFLLAWPELLTMAEEMLGPWPIGGPARLVATRALNDTHWQRDTRQRLQLDASRLAAMLTRQGLAPAGDTALFQWVSTLHAPELHEALARQGILTRPFTEPASLRFGLPATELEWARLETALQQITG